MRRYTMDTGCSGRSTSPRRVRTSGRTRWWIVWTLFFSTVTNYISRQTFSVLAPMLASQYHFSHADLGEDSRCFSDFLRDYVAPGRHLPRCCGHPARLGPGGKLLVGGEHLYRLRQFCFRFRRISISAGDWRGPQLAWRQQDGGGVVSQPRAQRRRGYLRQRLQRRRALAALIIPWIAIAFGWRWSFAFSGALGLVWLVMWLRVYHPIDRHPRVSPKRWLLFVPARSRHSNSRRGGVARWLELAKSSNVWAIVLGRGLTDPIWWFYVFWLPQYLSDARGFSLKRIALFAWIPFVAADLGNFTGGFISGYCIRRGIPVIRARMWVCAISCLPILAGIPAARVHSAYSALALICVALWGYASWSTMGLTLPSDLFPQEVVATVTGLSGFAAGVASAVFTFAVGFLVDRFS